MTALAANLRARHFDWLQPRHLLWLPILALVALGLGALTDPIGDLVFGTGKVGVASGFALVTLAAAPTVYRLRTDPLDAPGLYALSTYVMLGVASLAWLGTPVRPGPGLQFEDIAAALRIVAVGLAFFALGSRLLSKATPQPKLHVRPENAPPRALLVMLFSIAVAADVVGFTLGIRGYINDPQAIERFGGVSQAIDLLATGGAFVLTATAIAYWGTGDRRLRTPVIVFAAIAISIGFVAGERLTTLLPAVLVLFCYMAAKGRFPVLAAAAVLAGFFFFALPVNQEYRELTRNQSTSPRVALGKAITTAPSLSPTAAADTAGDFLFARLRNIDNVALIYAQTPSPFAYAGGEKYIVLPLMLTVPRALWEDKPKLDDAAEFTHTYGQSPRSIRSSTSMTSIGDLYRNFSWWGVAIGMFLVGMAVSGGMRLYRRYFSARARLIYIFALLAVVVYTEVDLPSLISGPGRAVLAAAVLAWLLLPGREGGPGYRRILSRA